MSPILYSRRAPVRSDRPCPSISNSLSLESFCGPVASLSAVFNAFILLRSRAQRLRSVPAEQLPRAFE
jgi:hypothetical protein